MAKYLEEVLQQITEEARESMVVTVHGAPPEIEEELKALFKERFTVTLPADIQVMLLGEHLGYDRDTIDALRYFALKEASEPEFDAAASFTVPKWKRILGLVGAPDRASRRLYDDPTYRESIAELYFTAVKPELL